MRVDLWAPDGSGNEQQLSTFLRAGQTEAAISLPRLEGQPLSYRVEVRRLSAGGEELVRSEQGQTSNLIVLQ
jgi:hypothetical protein